MNQGWVGYDTAYKFCQLFDFVFIDLNIAICYIKNVQLLGKTILEEFKTNHASSRKALHKWEKAIEGCKARHFVELKQTFLSVDLVGSAMVFDVGGNKIRVISVVSFEIQQLLVTHVLTHAEYDRKNGKILEVSC